MDVIYISLYVIKGYVIHLLKYLNIQFIFINL